MTSGKNDEALIGRIREEGEKNAAAILADAETYRKQAEARAEVEIAETEALLGKETVIEVASVHARKRTLAALERRKLLLGAKQKVIDGVYSRALAKWKSAGKAEKLARTEKLLEKYAEAGDEVILAANGGLSAADVSVLPVVKAKGLVVRANGTFDGGFVLSGSKCDKDFGDAAVLAAVREETETEIAEKLFGRE